MSVVTPCCRRQSTLKLAHIYNVKDISTSVSTPLSCIRIITLTPHYKNVMHIVIPFPSELRVSVYLAILHVLILLSADLLVSIYYLLRSWFVFLVCFLYCVLPLLYCNFYGAASVVRPCSCR